ncbi:response regulator [Aliiroseovarius subalbicans]|uniref:response regulator n=1 Tax=Aliiroseovarius subalbicans TaxID=2925840 RepID=UPI001F5AA216|nr:response regulator [Aliiroseovarius subalbicans]MCI2399241.1 response regulator [Aliiroseovarius subalbicans]
MKILVVDDDPTALALLEAALALYGFNNVTLKSTARDAMHAIKTAENPFECFLLDYRMPEIDGVGLCSTIHAMPEYRATPVIFVTAAKDRSSLNTAYAAGAVDYVFKPIDPQEIGVRVSIAEKLVLEERELKKQGARKIGQLDQGSKFPDFAIADPVPIFGVARVVSPYALENYLESRSNDRAQPSAVSALAINEFDEIFGKANPAFAFAVLQEVAKVIASSLERTSPLISYNGFGEFICASKKGDWASSNGHTRLINSRLARLDLRFADGSPCPVTVTLGKPASASIWSADKPVTLIEKALESDNGTGPAFRSAASSFQNLTACQSPALNL